MKTFVEFITEEAGKKLVHLEHADDLHINSGKAGFEHAVSVLHAAKKHVEEGHSNPNLTEKIDGSPSVVTGHHPETGKFFVASKSAFNKNPKINYSHEDIEKNHGHAPGLVHKLKAVFDHAKKVLPKKGVFQGDVLHTPEDHKHSDGHVSFKPNTLTYHAKGAEAEKVKASKVGVSLHTEYHGNKLEDMSAAPIRDHSKFKQHADVHLVSPEYKGAGKMNSVSEKKFNDHIEAAKKSHASTDYSKVLPHTEHIKTYINQTVREGTKPTFSGLKAHIIAKHKKAVESVSTPKAKDIKTEKMNSHISEIDSSKEHLSNALATQVHLANAKNELVKHLDKSHAGLGTSIAGKKASPEGYVFHHGGELTKLVNRKQFSAANFANNRGK